METYFTNTTESHSPPPDPVNFQQIIGGSSPNSPHFPTAEIQEDQGNPLVVPKVSNFQNLPCQDEDLGSIMNHLEMKNNKKFLRFICQIVLFRSICRHNWIIVALSHCSHQEIRSPRLPICQDYGQRSLVRVLWFCWMKSHIWWVQGLQIVGCRGGVWGGDRWWSAAWSVVGWWRWNRNRSDRVWGFVFV